MIFLDTHVLVWLYEGLTDKFSKQAKQTLESDELYISPMVELELNFLNEIKRLRVGGAQIVRNLNAHLGIEVSRVDFYRTIEEAQQFTWTRDPFDRLIVANASVFQSPLMTKDKLIHKHYSLATW
ncbi:MAG: PIN domain-containing protein [Gammaproteobacteria bacterium]|nr:PIN domain-containing protein [Gammaproteobacteria bacterium]